MMEIKELLDQHEIDYALELLRDFYNNDNFSESITGCEYALRYSEEYPEMVDEDDVAEIKQMLMLSCMCLGDFKKALKYADELIDNYGDFSWLLIKKSRILYYLSDMKHAESIADKAVSAAIVSNGVESTEYVNALANHADILSRGFDEKKAAQLFEEAYEVASEIDMPLSDLGFLIRDIGRFYDLTVNYHKALIKYEEAYEILIKVLDEHDVDLLGLINDIGCTLNSLGYRERAIERFEELLKICIELYGEYSYNTLITKGNLANTYKKNDDYEKAEILYLEIIKGHLSLNGEESQDYQREIINYASLLSAMGNSQKAIEYRIKAYNLIKKYRGDNDLDTLDSLRGIAGEYQYLGKYTEAVTYYRKSLPDIKEDSKLDFFNCLSVTGLAYCYANMNDYQSGMDMINIALNSLDEIEERADVIKAGIYRAEAILALNKNDYNLAEKKSKSALKLCEKSETSDSTDVISYKRDYASVLSECNKHDEAVQQLMDCLYLFKPTRYNNDVAININCDLAVAEAVLGNIASAEKYSAYAEKCIKNGLDDIDLFKFWYTKAFLSKLKNDNNRFVEYIEKAKRYLEELSGDERSRDKLKKLLAK